MHTNDETLPPADVLVWSDTALANFLAERGSSPHALLWLLDWLTEHRPESLPPWLVVEDVVATLLDRDDGRVVMRTLWALDALPKERRVSIAPLVAARLERFDELDVGDDPESPFAEALDFLHSVDASAYSDHLRSSLGHRIRGVRSAGLRGLAKSRSPENDAALEEFARCHACWDQLTEAVGALLAVGNAGGARRAAESLVDRLHDDPITDHFDFACIVYWVDAANELPFRVSFSMFPADYEAFDPEDPLKPEENPAVFLPESDERARL